MFLNSNFYACMLARRTCTCVFFDFLSHSEDPDETGVSIVCLDRNILRGQKYIYIYKIQTMNPKIQNGRIHANCINIYGKIHHYC